MKDETHPIAAFDPDASSMRTRVRGEDLLLTRVSVTRADPPVSVSAVVEDAFAMVFQLQPLPAHILWHDQRQFEVPAGPAHALTFFDLAGKAGAHIPGAFDSLHFRVPRPALDSFADLAGTRRVERLHVPGGPFASVDTLVASLSGALIGTLGARDVSPLLPDHLLMSLLAHVTAHYGDGLGSEPRTSGGLAPWQVRRAKALLDLPDGSAPPLAEVAAAVGVSVAHFARAFKQGTGVTPWAWHQTRRLERAQTLLRDSSLPLAQVATLAGFSDQSHFTRAFGAKLGISPGQWRRERRID